MTVFQSSKNTDRCDYSVVLPVLNEETCLEDILKEIDTQLRTLGKTFEIICVDDGSTDATWSIITQMHQEKSSIKGIHFSRNFGHQLAVYCGIKHSKGDYIGILDADGQDPPEVLRQLFQKCQEGYDVAYAIRKKRKEKLMKRIFYSLFYRIYRKVVPFNVPINSGDFAVFNRTVADFIRSRPEKKPFVRGLRSWYGGKQIGVEYERHKRVSGIEKYTYAKLFLLAVNALISFSKIPLRFIAISGMVISFFSFFAGLYLIFLKITDGIPILGWTSTTVLIILFGGLNLFVLGVIGEYIGDIFEEVKARPQFIVNESLGIQV